MQITLRDVSDDPGLRDPGDMVARQAAVMTATPDTSRRGWVGILLVDLILIIRPWFAPIPMAPLLAARVLADPAGGLTAALTDPATWWALISFALTWTAVAMINDAFDGRTDLHNPRHTRILRIARRMGKAQLIRLAIAVGLLDLLLVIITLGPLFVLGTALVLLIGWLYSAPPARLKGRPGLDVLANAVPVGFLAPVAGWLLAGSPGMLPWQLGSLCTLTIAALYLPTTVMDRAADEEVGVRTTAVALGERRTYRLGTVLWIVSVTLYLIFLTTGTFARITLTWYEVVAWIPVVAGYVLARRPTIARLALLSAMMAAHCFLIWATP